MCVKPKTYLFSIIAVLGVLAVACFAKPAALFLPWQLLPHSDGFQVFVPSTNFASQTKAGLPKIPIQSAVESRLRSEGIAVLSEDERMNLPASRGAVLHIEVDATPVGNGKFVYHLSAKVMQWGRLCSNQDVLAFVPTWEECTVGLAASSDVAAGEEKALKYLIDRFVSDYRLGGSDTR